METKLSLAERAQAPSSLAAPPARLGLTWRPVALDDVPALAELVQQIEAADGLSYRTSAEEVEEALERPSTDLEHDSLVGVDPDGTMRAWARVDTYPGDVDVIRATSYGGVHGDRRRRGIGAAVVAWTTGRARQLLAASGKDAPGRIAVYLDDQCEAAARVYQAAGYSAIRYYTDMRRPLDAGIPAVRDVPGIRIEPWPDDDEPVRVAHNEAFADHWGSQPISAESWTSDRSMFMPSWSFVARDEATGEIVGYVDNRKYELDWTVAGYTSGYVEGLGVRRAWRGRGIARALLATTMALLRAEGIEYAEIGVDTANPSGAHNLYAALGFEVFETQTQYSIEV